MEDQALLVDGVPALFAVGSLAYKMWRLNSIASKVPSALKLCNWLFLLAQETVGKSGYSELCHGKPAVQQQLLY